MKLSTILSPLVDLRLAFQFALLPTLRDVLTHPSLLLSPRALSRVFMAHLWVPFGAGTDEGAREAKEGLITANAYGVVLDIGAAHGHTAKYLPRSKVSKYVALEPNVLMHDRIRTSANNAGYYEANDSLVILSCGAEDISTILDVLSPEEKNPPIDTLIFVLTLCTIPSPQQVLERLVRDILKPGGQLLFYEHVLSPRPDVAWWQRFWAPIWQFPFDGCRMDRPSHLWIDSVTKPQLSGSEGTIWQQKLVWGKEGEPDEHLFWHRIGKYVKQSDP